MKGFFDAFKGDNAKKSGSNKDNSNNNNKNNMNNAMNNMLGGLGLAGTNKPQRFVGGGQSLGGNLPGTVIPVVLAQPGPLGLKVEKRSNTQGTAIVSMVVEGSQAHAAGLQRGDIVCFDGSNGQEEMMFDMFLELAKSNQRPLCFEVRRITGPSTKNKKNSAPAVPSSSSTVSGKDSNMTAEAYNRKQALLAAAEAREKANKKFTKVDPAKKALKQQQKEQSAAAAALNDANAHIPNEPQSEAARAAVEAAKYNEAMTAAQLGYNPYETNRVTAGQARNATVATKHGAVGEGGGATPLPTTTTTTTLNPQQSSSRSVSRSTSNVSSTPSVQSPRDALIPADDDDDMTDFDPQFQGAYEKLVTSNPEHVTKTSLNIVTKLLLNATTKEGEKFRRIRLKNPKIQSYVVDVEGALEILMAGGFELMTEDETQESILVYPPDNVSGPTWLPKALRHMERYANS